MCRETLKFDLTNEDKSQVIKKLKRILKTKGFSINLSGKFKNENEFKLIDKITIGIYIQGGGSPAVLKGKFTESKEKIVLTIIAKSHTLFPLTSILLLFLFIPIFLFDDTNNAYDKMLGIIVCLLFVVIMNLAGNFFKKRLLNKTLKVLGFKSK